MATEGALLDHPRPTASHQDPEVLPAAQELEELAAAPATQREQKQEGMGEEIEATDKELAAAGVYDDCQSPLAALSSVQDEAEGAKQPTLEEVTPREPENSARSTSKFADLWVKGRTREASKDGKESALMAQVGSLRTKSSSPRPSAANSPRTCAARQLKDKKDPAARAIRNSLFGKPASSSADSKPEGALGNTKPAIQVQSPRKPRASIGQHTASSLARSKATESATPQPRPQSPVGSPRLSMAQAENGRHYLYALAESKRKQDEQQRECTFRPSINQNSQRICYRNKGLKRWFHDQTSANSSHVLPSQQSVSLDSVVSAEGASRDCRRKEFVQAFAGFDPTSSSRSQSASGSPSRSLSPHREGKGGSPNQRFSLPPQPTSETLQYLEQLHESRQSRSQSPPRQRHVGGRGFGKGNSPGALGTWAQPDHGLSEMRRALRSMVL